MGVILRVFAAAVCLMVSLTPAAPAGAQGIEVVETAFQGWMSENRVGRAVLAVARDRALVLARGYGGADPGAPGLLASLSKAITAACVATLVDDGKLEFDTTVGSALGGFFQRHGAPADLRLMGATIGALLSHRAGFGRSGGDPATGTVLVEHLRANPAGVPAIDLLLSRALRQRLAEPPGQAFAYTNAAYLMLGAVVESASQRGYEDYCRDTVLRPLGIQGARLDPGWAVMSAFGGWSLSGPQYLRFLELFSADSRALGPKARAFLTSGAGKWTNDRQDVYYALGLFVRPVANGRNLWHAGGWTYSLSTPANRALREDLGTYAVAYASGISWFASFAPRPPDAKVAELDRVITQAVRKIATWPAQDLYPRFGLR